MSLAKDDPPEALDSLQIDIPEMYGIDNRQFYYNCKTSNELCSAGLFTCDTESITKKHRKLKCNFCHSVLSGWKGKFCQHLDKCERAQNFFLSHPGNIQYELLQRKAKREHTDHSNLSEMKRRNAHGELFNLPLDDYLTFLATGFVCSTGISKSIFDNEFLRNLCFSLHWNPPSLYTIQKKIGDCSKLIRTTIDSYLSSQSSVTLLVYPWVDINKKHTISYLACSSSGVVMFFNTILCNQDNWCNVTAFQQIQVIIQSLKEKNIDVTMVYYDDLFSFEDCKLYLQENSGDSFLPVIGNLYEWCRNCLSLIFSHSYFLDVKQLISLLYQSLSKPSPFQEAFFTQTNDIKRDYKFTPIEDDNWVSLFASIHFILDHYHQIVSTIQYCVSSNIIQFSHPLASTQFDEDFYVALLSIYEYLNDLASCCGGRDVRNLNYFSVYCILYAAQQKLKDTHTFNSDAVKYALSVVTNCLEYFNQDVLCILYFLTTSYSNDVVQFSEQQMKTIMKLIYPETEVFDQCVKEFDLFVKDSHIDYNWDNILDFWKGVGKSQFPLLSQLACIVLSYPCINESFAQYSKIKTYIHTYVRLKKDDDKNIFKNDDELVISCNRHLVIRWDLDFQYDVCLSRFVDCYLNCLYGNSRFVFLTHLFDLTI